MLDHTFARLKDAKVDLN